MSGCVISKPSEEQKQKLWKLVSPQRNGGHMPVGKQETKFGEMWELKKISKMPSKDG